LGRTTKLITLCTHQHKPKDIITLFHKSSSPASIRVQSLLKRVSANASETATEDQASDHSHQTALQRSEFELNVTEDPPTADQLQTILEYVGTSAIGTVVKGAKTTDQALKKFKESSENFQRPVVCPLFPEPKQIWALTPEPVTDQAP